jgi:hypothetical protein
VKRWERWTFNLLSLAVAVTGFVYFWMKYAMVSDDPFAVVNHPWQAAVLGLHVVVSPAFILMFGVILNSHVMKKIRAPRIPNRRTGLLSLGTFGAMVITGYLLQIASSEGLLQLLVVVHVATGAVFSLAYTAHLLISVKLARVRPEAAIREVA